MSQQHRVGAPPTGFIYKLLFLKPALAAFVVAAMFSTAVVGTQAAGFLPSGGILSLIVPSGQNSQEASDELTSDTTIGAEASNDSANTVDVDQEDGGNGNSQQDAWVTPTADALLQAAVDAQADNTAGVEQESGDGQNTQGSYLTGDANTDVGLGLGSSATNDTDVDQNAGGDAGNYVQTIDSASAANSGLFSSLFAKALNLFGIAQEAGDGQNNQHTGVDAQADTAADQDLNSAAANNTNLAQNAGLGTSSLGNYNVFNNYIQNIYNTNVANTWIDASQNVFAINNTIVNVVGGDGQNTQNVWVNTDANAVGNQAVDGSSTNNTDIEQNAGGDGSGNFDQQADNSDAAGTEIAAAQQNGALNTTVVNQEGGDGQNDQNAEVGVSADANADQTVEGTSENDTEISQNAEGDDGNYNQGAWNTASALTGIEAAQENSGINLTEIAQSGGDGQNDQDVDLESAAWAGAGQDVAGNSSNETGIEQNASGDSGNFNQTAAADSEAETGVGASQLNTALNTAGIEQESGDGQADQDVYAGLNAAANADQSVEGTSSNGTSIQQNAGDAAILSGGYGSNNYNQDASAENDASTEVGADQVSLALNTLGVSQVAGGGNCTANTYGCNDQSTQTVDAELGAETEADQDILGDADNDTVIVQNAGGDGTGNFNQGAWAGSDAETGVGAEQINSGINIAEVTQESGAGQASQGAWLGSDAAAGAEQSVAGTSSNGTEIAQTEEADGGNYVQTADSTSEADADVWGSQNNDATNLIGVAQESDGTQADQHAAVDAGADADAAQDVLGSSTNDTAIAQNAGGSDGNYNQAASSDSAAGTSVEASQENDALNAIGVAQSAGSSILSGYGSSDQVSQVADIAADADADASQEVEGNSANTTSIAQNAGESGILSGGYGSDNYVQTADAGSAAGTEVAAAQVNVGSNLIDVAQIGSDGQNDQDATIGANADADAAQSVWGNASNATGIEQNASGDGSGNFNQGAWAGNEAGTAIDAAQINTGVNDIDLAQVGGEGQNDQDAWVGANAVLNSDQDVGGTSTNVTGIEQNAEGEGGNYVQNADSASAAGTDIETLQITNADNFIGILQLAEDGQNSQGADVEANAALNSDQDVAGVSTNVTGISQNAGGDSGNFNQGAWNETAAGTEVDAAQINTGVNDIDLAQVAGDGQNDQDAAIATNADAWAAQTVAGVSTNVNGIEQNAGDYSLAGFSGGLGGDAYNQAANNAAVAATAVEGAQVNVGTNDVNVAQLGGAGQNDQDAAVEAGATADAGQAVIGTSTNVNGIAQNAGGDGTGNFNQGAWNDSAAVTGAWGSQENDALNLVGIAQVAGGDSCANSSYGCDDQASQGAWVATDADADAGQAVIGTSTNVNGIEQNAAGEGGNYNQNADSNSLAGTQVAGAQQNGAENFIGIGQAADSGQADQNADVAASADADAAQTVIGTSTNVTGISQNAEGDDGNFNQGASSNNIAGTSVGAAQENDALNIIGVAQEAGDGSIFSGSSDAGQAYQEANILADADADAAQGVVGSTTNVTGITQNAGDAAILSGGYGSDNYNQTADALSEGATAIGASQANVGTNIIGVGQDAGDDGQADQQAWIDAGAAAAGAQTVAGTTVNGTGIEQNAGSDGTGNFNQGAWSDSAALTEIGAGQVNLGLNTVGVTQSAEDGQNSQTADIAADADSDAAQVVTGTSVNGTDISQNAGGDSGNYNQNASATSEAGTAIGAEQNAGAVNDIGVEQSAGAGQADQHADIVANADSDAAQIVVGTSGNGTSIEQNAGDAAILSGGYGSDNYNQTADSDSDAQTEIGASQNNASANQIDVGQEAEDGQASQEVAIEANADADAVQAIVGNADNVTEIAQNAGSDGTGNFNQGAWAGSDAELAIGASQNNAALNDVEVGQSAGGSNCAHGTYGCTDQTDQNAWLGLEAAGAAVQAIEGNSDNETAIEQNADGDSGNYNQTADAGSEADTAIDADQSNAAANLVSIEQIGGSGQAYQNVDIEADADADAVQQIWGNSNNATEIAQNASGDSGNFNQGAWAGNSAETEVAAAQDNAALNDITVSQDPNGQSNQNVVIDVDADADAVQHVGGSASNETAIEQNAGDSALLSGGYGSNNYNQNADSSNDAQNSVVGEQQNAAVNDIDVEQGCDGPVCAQGVEISPEANAAAFQDIFGSATNGTGISQNASGDGSGNYNQGASSDNTANNSTSGWQTNGALNNLGVTQVCVGVVCAQYTKADPTANANAAQNVNGTASNGTDIEQNADGEGGNYNQGAWSGNTANNSVGAGQENSAVNNVVLNQGCQSIVCAQYVDTTPTANANAAQDVSGDSTNGTSIQQNADGEGGAYNQNVDSEATADTDVQAAQTNGAVNNVIVNQGCKGLVCAQWTGVNPLANANASQNVSGTSTNGTNVTQNAGGSASSAGYGSTGNQATQDANTSNTANTNVGASQQNGAQNNVVVNQACDSPTCAQGGTVTPTATSNSDQTVNGTAGNATTIEQTAPEGQASQTANDTSTANTNIGVDHTNDATNNVTVDQTGGAGQTTQNATVAPTATSNSTITISGGSSNNTTIIQK